MIINLSTQNSVVKNWVAEIRDIGIQKDRMRFRRNLERIGEIAAYEISKLLPFVDKQIQTPLGQFNTQLIDRQPVIATLLRAGLPLHQGLLNYFDGAGNAFVSAYRKHQPDGHFSIEVEYVTSPALNHETLIVCDVMLATAASIIKAIEVLKKQGQPSHTYIVIAIASRAGLKALQQHVNQNVTILCGDIDEELNAKGYIVPGLGDAGDLAYGIKIQQ